MSTRFRVWLCLAAFLAGFVPAGPALGAIKVRKPVLERPRPKPKSVAPAMRTRRPRTPGQAYFVGSVVFARGDQVVAEIEDGAKPKERLVVFDTRLRRKGKAVVLKALDQGVYLLQLTGGMSAGPGDHVARESEREAAARVIRDGGVEEYREFLAQFPSSRYRPRMARELFRLAMRAQYPTFPGTVIEGRVHLAEELGREIPLNQITLKLDRFIIARTDEKGRFRIEGLPKLVEPVDVKLAVRDERFRMAAPAVVTLGAGKYEEASIEVSVSVTPTVLVGRVFDARGAGLPGAEVWTHPASMSVLTDDEGRFKISRRKKKAGTEGGGATDEPLFGGEYEVYAHRRGYDVQRAVVSAESYRENPVPDIPLVRQDLVGEPLPDMPSGLRAYLQIDASSASPRGGGPRLNR